MSDAKESPPAGDEVANQSGSSTKTLATGLSTLGSPRLSIRWRLTLWYAGSLCMLLAGFGVLVWTMTSAWLLSQTDLELTDEVFEQLKFTGTEVKNASGSDRPPTDRVDFQIADTQWLGYCGSAPQQCSQTGEKFLERERLDQIVVRSGIEP